MFELKIESYTQFFSRPIADNLDYRAELLDGMEPDMQLRLGTVVGYLLQDKRASDTLDHRRVARVVPVRIVELVDRPRLVVAVDYMTLRLLVGFLL